MKYKEDVINKRKDTKERALKSQEKLENLDTQMLLKRRLQRIILVGQFYELRLT